MAETAFHFIQHAFAQRAVGQAQIADRQRIEHAAQDSQPRHEHRLAIFRQPRQAQRAEAFELQHLLGEHFRAIQVMRPSFPHRHQHFVGGLDGARGAQRVLPALNAVLPGQRFQLLRRRQPRAAEVVLLISPPGKNSWAKLTQPMRRLSASSGSKSSPITSSVDPPPMSITSLRPFSG